MDLHGEKSSQTEKKYLQRQKYYPLHTQCIICIVDGSIEFKNSLYLSFTFIKHMCTCLYMFHFSSDFSSNFDFSFYHLQKVGRHRQMDFPLISTAVFETNLSGLHHNLKINTRDLNT